MEEIKKFSIGFAVFHIAAFVGFLFFMEAQSGKAQHQLYWFFWLLIDFPVSLLMFLAMAIELRSIWVLYFLHGVIGTIWWYFLPNVFVAIDQRNKKKSAS